MTADTWIRAAARTCQQVARRHGLDERTSVLAIGVGEVDLTAIPGHLQARTLLGRRIKALIDVHLWHHPGQYGVFGAAPAAPGTCVAGWMLAAKLDLPIGVLQVFQPDRDRTWIANIWIPSLDTWTAHPVLAQLDEDQAATAMQTYDVLVRHDHSDPGLALDLAGVL